MNMIANNKVIKIKNVSIIKKNVIAGDAGSRFCEHDIRKYNCISCGGSGICEHNKKLL
jgi:hypothetical protein